MTHCFHLVIFLPPLWLLPAKPSRQTRYVMNISILAQIKNHKLTASLSLTSASYITGVVSPLFFSCFRQKLYFCERVCNMSEVWFFVITAEQTHESCGKALNVSDRRRKADWWKTWRWISWDGGEKWTSLLVPSLLEALWLCFFHYKKTPHVPASNLQLCRHAAFQVSNHDRKKKHIARLDGVTFLCVSIERSRSSTPTTRFIIKRLKRVSSDPVKEKILKFLILVAVQTTSSWRLLRAKTNLQAVLRSVRS